MPGDRVSLMQTQFGDKIVLVTGAASGIGRATAQAFAQRGAAVIVADIAQDAGAETVDLIDRGGGQAHFIKTDVADADSVGRLVQTTIDLFGRLDIAVNNAGIGGENAKVADYPHEDWYRVLNINLTGVFYCMQFEIRQMLKQQNGVIVNTSSVAGLRGLANSAAYSASKHGVIGLTRSAALEYARQNIRINAVCPVFTRTPLFNKLFETRPDFEEKLVRNIPMGRYGQPEDIAGVILWLCSNEAGFVTGQAFSIDGGLTAR